MLAFAMLSSNPLPYYLPFALANGKACGEGAAFAMHRTTSYY